MDNSAFIYDMLGAVFDDYLSIQTAQYEDNMAAYDDDRGSLVGGGNENRVYMRSDTYLDAATAKRIVDNPDPSKVIQKPPVKPSDGDIYVYSHGGGIDKAGDWKSDQYIWVNAAGYAFPKNQSEFWTKTYYISTGAGDKKTVREFPKNRPTFLGRKSVPFFRTIFRPFKESAKNSLFKRGD